MKKIIIFGDGGFFKEQFYWLKDDLAKKNDYEIEAIASNRNQGKKIFNIPVIDEKEITYSEKRYLYIAIGSIDSRINIIKKFSNYNFYTLIHPSAIISQGAIIGKGCTISPNTIIAGDAKIGDFNSFNFNSMISHDCVTGNNNIFSPGSKILGWCKIGNNNYFGADSIMLPKTEIGNSNMIGANATLNSNFENSKILIGTPAKIYKKEKD